MRTILIRYLCWGCGAERIVEEETEETVGAAEPDRWNLCPDCKGEEVRNNEDIFK